MSLLVGLALAACAIIAPINGDGVLGLRGQAHVGHTAGLAPPPAAMLQRRRGRRRHARDACGGGRRVARWRTVGPAGVGGLRVASIAGHLSSDVYPRCSAASHSPLWAPCTMRHARPRCRVAIESTPDGPSQAEVGQVQVARNITGDRYGIEFVAEHLRARRPSATSRAVTVKGTASLPTAWAMRRIRAERVTAPRTFDRFGQSRG